MKILHLIYDHINNPWVGGGGAVRCFEINKRLVEKGHNITIISGKYQGAKDYAEGNLKFKFLGTDKSYKLSVFSYAFESIKYLKNHAKDYDIVVEDFAPWNPVFSFLFHKKTVLQLHQREELQILKRYGFFGLPFYLIEKFYPRIYKNIICVSEISLNKFKLNGKIIPNGVDEKHIEKDINIGNYIGFIGRIDIFHKGLDLLLEALEDIKFPLKIAGKGKDEIKLKNLITEKGLNNNVEILGFLTGQEKLNFIKNAKFIVMPSRFEGQSIVTLEVASMGKPLIVSDIPELSYVIENGFGLSFKSENPEDLKDKMKTLWENEEMILQMGKKALEYAKNLTWDKLALDYEEILLSLTGTTN
ncbi:glycosyltransferase family 4 protein [Calditerrivibrio nitroreducens]|uniref:Glycosyl transferase group 1 n=1 Tax=Calditerrivibrio nitroreducens (strain DSM 19672 / NBRC 101217 / Yu37-1) TaxID=768670 RepID=E4TJ33_CALNY|nr:glycosyltransferase family 4 protein [Calditerrivibrio nitroreducens]ADR18069.1 glycosyl transferase group 1 [Calditerrivibrio nitroreducens DSM 19672]